MGAFYHVDGQGDLLLQLRVQPKASVDRICGAVGESLKVRITAPPIEGKANTHLVRYLAKTWSLRTSQIHLESGRKSRSKRIRISGLTRAQVDTLVSIIRDTS